MNNKKQATKICFNLIYLGKDTALFSLTSAPRITNLIFGLKNDEKKYSDTELKSKFAKTPIDKGTIFHMSVINMESKREKEFRINISKHWETGKVSAIPGELDISNHLKDIGIID